METTPPVCECHGKPMYWHKKKDMRAGGLWRCLVRKREVQNARREKANQQQRDRYDSDPIFRIGKRLRDDSRGRGKTLARKKEALRG